MRKIIKTECGQFVDEKLIKQINDDVELFMKEFCNKYKDIDSSDLYHLLISNCSYMLGKYHTMRNIDRVMKEKGYKSSDESKTIEFIEKVIK